jgi:hypothetical protein
MNATELLIANIDDNVVGIITYLTVSGAVKKTDLDRELSAAGFEPDDWSVNPRTPFGAFAMAARECRRKKYRVGAGATQETRFVVLLPVAGSGDGESEWSAHIAVKSGKATRTVGQIGTIGWTADPVDGNAPGHIETTYHTVLGSFLRLPSESNEDYADRFAGATGTFTPSDLDAFAETVADLNRRHLDRAGLIDPNRLRHIFLAALVRPEIDAIMLRPTGGIYFVPHLPDRGSKSPALIWQRLANAVEAVATTTSVYQIRLPKEDAGGIRAVCDAAQGSLFERIATVESELDSLEDVKSIRQITGRAAEIEAVLRTARLYADLVGMKAGALQARADKIGKALQDTATGLRSKQAEAKESKRAATARDWSDLNLIVEVPTKADTTAALRRSRMKKGEAVAIPGTDIQVRFTGASYTAEVKAGRGRYRGSWNTSKAAVEGIFGAFANA